MIPTCTDCLNPSVEKPWIRSKEVEATFAVLDHRGLHFHTCDKHLAGTVRRVFGYDLGGDDTVTVLVLKESPNA